MSAHRTAAAAAVFLSAIVIAGCVAPVPMKLAESFSNPDIASANNTRPRKPAADGQACTLIVEGIEDERGDPRMLGNVAGRSVHAPENVNAWLRNVVEGLDSRGIELVFDPQAGGGADPLVASMKLRIAWVSDIHTSKTATTLWHLRLRQGDKTVVDSDFRGSDTVMNWSSGDGELQRMVDRAFGRSLDLMAAEVRRHCSG